MRLAPTRSTAALVVALCLAACAAGAAITEAAVSELRPLEKKIRETWDFQKPSVSEQRFRDLAAATPAARVGERVLYETQVARALGLKQDFDAAHAVLDSADAEARALAPGATAQHVR